jgi:hypothetical protein
MTPMLSGIVLIGVFAIAAAAGLGLVVALVRAARPPAGRGRQ